MECKRGLQLGPAINHHYCPEIQFFLDWQIDRDARALTPSLDDSAAPTILPNTQNKDSDSESITLRRIDTDAAQKNERFWHMESDSNIAAEAALLASRSPKFPSRSDYQRQLSLQVDVLVRGWEETNTQHVTNLEAQRQLNLSTSGELRN